MPDMTGKIVLVTGANSGIGLATAHGLAHQGATVVMICRNQEKGAAAQAEVRQKSSNPNVHLLLADLSVQAQVRRVADEFKARFNRLDVLINNAAIIPSQREITTEGFELQFAVNHLAYFLLTHLLLDVIKASAPARIVNVAAALHTVGKIDFADLQSEKSYTRQGWATYSNTKLMNVLFTLELARRLQGSGVTVNCLHPGIIGSNLARGVPTPLLGIFQRFAPTPEQGAKTSLYLATSPDVATITGQYFARCKPAPISRAGRDATLAKQLWDISAAYCGLAGV